MGFGFCFAKLGGFMRKLSSYIGRYWYGYLFAVASMVTAIALDMLYPKITQQIVDDVILGGQMEILTKLLTGIVLVGIGRSIFGYCKEFTFDFLSSKIGAEMRKDLFNHIQTLSMRYFDDTNTGELMARVKDDVDKIQNALGYVGMLLIEVTIHVVFVLYCMFSLNWKMAFLPVTVMLCCAMVAIIMERKLDKVYEDISEENAVLTTVAEENLAGVRTVKAFAREDYEIKKFLSHNERYYDLNITQSKVLVRYYPLFQFVGKVLPVAITILGGISVMNGNMSLGALVAYVEYSRNCTWPMEMMGWLTNDLSSAVASYKKIKKIYEVKPEIEDDQNVVTLDHVSGNVEFDHVSFRLDGKQILSDISFSVKEGKTLGIMGATGSGKSSIINMLHRFDARAKFFSFLLLIVAVILTHSSLEYVMITAIWIALIALSHCPLRPIFGSVQRMRWFFILVFLTNAFFFHADHPLWKWWIFTLSQEGIAQGFQVIYRVILILVLSNLLTLTTPPLAITGAIQTMLRPLKFIRLPADDIAMILSVAIQFIPTLMEETDSIRKAQIARGARLDSKRLTERARAMLPLVIPIFVAAFRRADELAMAMEARGYRRGSYQVPQKHKSIPRSGWCALCLCTLLIVAEILIV